jgi:transcriptional regulator with XRE-family HTH domain
MGPSRLPRLVRRPAVTLRRPLQPHELEPLRRLGQDLRRLRVAAGLSAEQLARVSLRNRRTVERIEQGARRTRRSTLAELVDVLLLACPDLGEQEALVQQLVAAAGPALAPESPYAAKTKARREGKAERLAERRALYRHLWQ